MKKLLGAIGILLIGLVVIAGFSCDSNEGPPSGYEVYQNEEHGFRLYYPENWQQTYVAGTVVSFISPGTDVGRENINVVIESCGDMSLAEYVNANRGVIAYLFEDSTITNEKSVEVQGQIGYDWIVRWTLEGIQLKQKQVFFVRNGKGYVLTCSATVDSYDDYIATFNEVINSFVIE